MFASPGLAPNTSFKIEFFNSGGTNFHIFSIEVAEARE
jgi:hypothetical protein